MIAPSAADILKEIKAQSTAASLVGIMAAEYIQYRVKNNNDDDPGKPGTI
ncbi:MAG: hypothetical protein ABIF71_07075 [Planctomycetota bacterium]